MKLNLSYRLSLYAAAVCVCAGCSDKPVDTPEVIRPVQTMVVEDTKAARERAFSGTARAAVETPLSFRVSGEIIELPVKIGQQVEAGALIARLDDVDHRIQVEQLKAEISATEAQLKQAKAEYDRTRTLYEQDRESKSMLDAARAAYESNQARRQSTVKSLELAEQQLEYCVLRAPVAGTVSSRPVDLHQAVSAGQSIASLASGEGMEFEMGVPEVLITDVRVGAPARVTFDAVEGAVFRARVSEVGIAPSTSSTYPVRLRILEEDARLRPGMAGEAVLSFASRNNGLYVPAVAVVGNPDGTRHVWVFEAAGGTVQRRAVKVGGLTSEGLQILEGLSAGEEIAVRGVHRLQDGMKVKRLAE